MGSESGTDSDGESDAVSLGGGPMECDHDKRTARFTEYSMTSAVIPRSEGVFLIWWRMMTLMIVHSVVCGARAIANGNCIRFCVFFVALTFLDDQFEEVSHVTTF